jgi:hypothetical protein
MQPNLDDLSQRREALIQQIRAIKRLRRGSLSEQFLKAKGAPDAPPHGPYYVLQGFVGGKKFAHRVPSDQAAQVQQDVANYRLLQGLVEELVNVSDQLTCLQDQTPDRKKNSRPRPSPRRSSRKPPPS